MRWLLLPVIAAASIAVQIASAADLPVKAPAVMPAPAPIYNWTGFYIGGHVGGAWTRADGSWDPLPSPASFGANPISGDFNSSGIIGGVQIGYNWQFAPSWVAGIEGDFSWTDAGSTFDTLWTGFGSATPIGPAFFTTMDMHVKWLASVRGRLGYLVAPQWLAYATGGVAWGSVDFSALATNSGSYLATTSFSETSTGYVVGAGVEWMLAPNWMLRGEYLFYHLNSSRSVIAFDSTGSNPTFPSGYNWNDVEISVVRAAVSYKF
jgi:outer membrane immunogenic protein